MLCITINEAVAEPLHPATKLAFYYYNVFHFKHYNNKSLKWKTCSAYSLRHLIPATLNIKIS